MGNDPRIVLSLLERHGNNLRAAAREAGITVAELRAKLREHTRPYFIERVRNFYGEKLRRTEVERVADQLMALELKQAS
jgi:hypothetical protein